LAGSAATPLPNAVTAGGTIVSGGHNLSSDGSGNLTAAGDLPNTNPLLDPNGLANNGGPTQTIPLLPGRPAINAGSNAQAPHPGFVGPYELENWTSSGITGGSTTITPSSGPATSAQFSYNVNLGNPGGGVSFRTATFSTTAAASGTVSLNYDYAGFHAFFMTNETLQLYADGPSGRQTITLVNQNPASPANPSNFDYSGSTSITVNAGFGFGFIVGGSNFDSNSQINGTLTVSNLVTPASTDQRGVSRIINGTVDIGAFESRGFTMDVAGGNNQSAVVGTAFGTQLAVTV